MTPDRLRGETVTFDIKDKKGKMIIEAGRRVGGRHIMLLRKAEIERLEAGDDYLTGRVLATDIIDTESGELLAEANAELDEAMVDKLREAGIDHVETLFINDVDRGAFMSSTLRADATTSELEAQVEIYRMMRPGEPPTKEAAQSLFNNLFFNSDRYDLSAVGRMKFDRRVRPDATDEELEAKRIDGKGKSVKKGVLTQADILDVMLEYSSSIKNGLGKVDDIDHLGNRRVRSVGEMAENQFRIGLVRVERAVKERLSLPRARS